MKYIICSDMAQFDTLNSIAKTALGLAPEESWCSPKINPVDGRIAFLVMDDLRDLQPSCGEGVVLDETWDFSTDPATQAQQLREKAIRDFIAAGYDTGLGFKMAVAQNDYLAFSALTTALINKAPAPDSIWTIKDMDGGKHQLPYVQYKVVMDGYFDYVYAAWQQL